MKGRTHRHIQEAPLQRRLRNPPTDAADDDTRRTRFPESGGFVVLRFWNNDVLGNPEGVPETIAAHLTVRTQSRDTIHAPTPTPPNPLLEREG